MTLINSDVVMLRRDYETLGKTEILLINQLIISDERDPDTLINETLNLYGSNIKARKHMAKKMLMVKQYIPILIDAGSGLAFFPLHTQSDYCKYYINCQHFLSVMDNDMTTIQFTTDQSIIVAKTPSFIKRQYERTLMMIDSQNKIREQHLNYSIAKR